MASTTSYCTYQQVVDRLRGAGSLYVADDDLGGTLAASEQAHITDAIAIAGAEINGTLALFFDLPITQDDASLNDWLRGIAVDLACERLTGRGGGSVPEAMAAAAAEARRRLSEVRSKKALIPGMPFPFEANEQARRLMGVPRVARAR